MATNNKTRLNSDQESAFNHIDESVSELYVLSPTTEDIAHLVYDIDRIIQQQRFESFTAHIIVSSDVVQEAVDHLDVGLLLKEYVNEGVVQLHESDGFPDRLFVGGNKTFMFADVGGETYYYESSDVNVDELSECISESISNSDGHKIRLPAHSTVREEIGEKFDESVLNDFDSIFQNLSEIDRPYSHAKLFLLLASINNELLYDISKMGERIGIASAATFSRAKNKLERDGVVETQKVPIDIGRPRQKLVISDTCDLDIDDPIDILDII